MKISAVVVTYNRKKLLLECLNALLSQTCVPNEIVVIDNASTDGTKDSLISERIIDNPIVKYTCLEANVGGAGGFYYGSKQAYDGGADWIWMMDDDCIPTPMALEKLIDAVQNVEASFFCSTVFREDGQCGSKPSVYAEGNWYEFLDKGIVNVSRATFVSFMMSRNAVEKCGLPYKQFFIWGDDSEYCTRLTRYYLPGYVVGGSKVIHKTTVKQVKRGSSFWHESNPNIIGRLHYLVRNSLVNDKEYGNVKSHIKIRIHYLRLFFTLMFGREKKKFRKIGQITRGFWDYHTGTYDRNAFKNRFTNHLDNERGK